MRRVISLWLPDWPIDLLRRRLMATAPDDERRAAAIAPIMLWSARGESHARNAAETFGVADLFHTICSKPGYVVDDLGWSWIKHTKVIRSIAIEPET